MEATCVEKGEIEGEEGECLNREKEKGE